MPARGTALKVTARELSAALRRRFHLAPDEQVSITVTKDSADNARRAKDAWAEIRGILSATEAEEMIRTIRAARRSRRDAPQLDAP